MCQVSNVKRKKILHPFHDVAVVLSNNLSTANENHKHLHSEPNDGPIITSNGQGQLCPLVLCLNCL
jgi:hypothetical protein